jgi:hypothetical protein
MDGIFGGHWKATVNAGIYIPACTVNQQKNNTQNK